MSKSGGNGSVVETAPVENREPHERAVMSVVATLDRFLATADVAKVYGEPVRAGETVVVPVAETFSVFGFGVGGGSGRRAKGDESHGGGGGGGGGGGQTFARGVAVVVASPRGVEIRPVIDVTKIALAALTAGVFVTGVCLGWLKPDRALRQILRRG